VGRDEFALRNDVVDVETEVRERAADPRHELAEGIGAFDVAEMMEDEARRQRLRDESLVVREALEVEKGERAVLLGHRVIVDSAAG
jgi:hypothetical protein